MKTYFDHVKQGPCIRCRPAGIRTDPSDTMIQYGAVLEVCGEKSGCVLFKSSLMTSVRDAANAIRETHDFVQRHFPGGQMNVGDPRAIIIETIDKAQSDEFRTETQGALSGGASSSVSNDRRAELGR